MDILFPTLHPCRPAYAFSPSFLPAKERPMKYASLCLCLLLFAAAPALAKMDLAPTGNAGLQTDTKNLAPSEKGLQPSSGTNTNVPEEEKGPVFLIDKISFKNINPAVEGFSIQCDGLETKTSGVSVLVGWVAYGDYFKSMPSRRLSSEVSNISIPSTLYDIAKKKGQKISAALFWRCHVTGVLGKGGYGPFSISDNACDTCLKGTSNPVIEGSF